MITSEFSDPSDACLGNKMIFSFEDFCEPSRQGAVGTLRLFCNAPEVAFQHVQPVPQSRLAACDVYALGLLVWDVFEYGDRSNRRYLFDSTKASTKERTAQRLMCIEILHAAIDFSNSEPVKLHSDFLKAISEASLDPEPLSRATSQKLYLMMCPDASKM